MENLLPIVLRDIENNIISHSHITSTHTIYFHSYQNFDVSIVEELKFESLNDGLLEVNGQRPYNWKEDRVWSSNQLGFNSKLFSVLEKINVDLNTYIDTVEDIAFSGKSNFGYTLFIPENSEKVRIKCVDVNGFFSYYEFELRLDNVPTSLLASENETEHYNDLLINNYLPTFEELDAATLGIKSELIKRLLLDFRSIVSKKGTKQSITNFFSLIGLDHESLTVFNEYRSGDGSLNINPNKLIDVATGNYHVQFDNYTQLGLDANNLPIRVIKFQDISDFFDKLQIAVILANKFFTLIEQNVTFFGLHFSANIGIKVGIRSNLISVFENDTIQFRKNLNINLKNFTTSLKNSELINNSLQISSELNRSEIKVSSENFPHPLAPGSNLYFINQEFFDDIPISNSQDPNLLRSIFGTCLHLNVISLGSAAEQNYGTFVEIKIKDSNDNEILVPKQFITGPLQCRFVMTTSGVYSIFVNVWDEYNNFEQYFYDMTIMDTMPRIDFETFNTSNLIEINKIVELPANSINLDIDSPSLSKTPTINGILPINLVPLDLADYYSIDQNLADRWLSENSKYVCPGINQNFKLDEISETIPLELSEQWLHIISLPYSSTSKLMLKVYDAEISKYVNIEYSDISFYSEIFDTLFVTVMDIDIDGIMTPYYFITTTETGIEIYKTTYNFVLVEENVETSIYDSCVFKHLPVNSDFLLFIRDSLLVPDFNHYISPTDTWEVIIDSVSGLPIEYPIIKSMFPRFVNSNNGYLKLGDILLCRLNDKFVVGETNILWTILNTFTGEILFTTSDYMLKYRVEDNICYTIMANFEVNGEYFEIKKQSHVSSFTQSFF